VRPRTPQSVITVLCTVTHDFLVQENSGHLTKSCDDTLRTVRRRREPLQSVVAPEYRRYRPLVLEHPQQAI
jgi:hypothetical protein